MMKLSTKTFLALCAGPLLLLAVSAAASDEDASCYNSDVSSGLTVTCLLTFFFVVSDRVVIT